MIRPPLPTSVLRRAAHRTVLALTVTGILAVTGCAGPKTAAGSAGSGSGSGSGPLVIGASVPLSGNLAGFGSFLKWGYEHAVKEVNDAGGLQVGNARRKVELALLDDKTDPNQTSANTDTLISAAKPSKGLRPGRNSDCRLMTAESVP